MPTDTRYRVRTLDDHFDWPGYETRKEWLERAAYYREHILVSTGLWPTPERCPLNAQVFGRLERDGYTIEKAYFESYPGFFVTGNLYRPRGPAGPFPGIISPHGHWGRGRLAHEENGSVPGRCINLARQGCVVFSYDMVGYNDSKQVDHRFGSQRDELWSVSPLGLQLWNSMRAIDFLQSLPDVDGERIGCTGASGGGTQTFLVTAVDERVKAAAPVNMISAYMQGGCKCENAPNLRIDMYNVEIGALAAPRPYLMVSATGDWTSHTLEEEHPDVRSIYELLGVPDRVKAVRFDAPHNYNKDSREAVYAWFGRWLLGDPDEAHFREQAFEVEKDEDMLVWAGRHMPVQAVSQEELIADLVRASEAQLEGLKPRKRGDLAALRATLGVSLAHALGAQLPARDEVFAEKQGEREADGRLYEALTIGRRDVGDRVPAALISRTGLKRGGAATVVVHPGGAASEAESPPMEALVDALLGRGRAVLLIDCYNTGQSAPPPGWAEAVAEAKYYTTYNRTDTAKRVQDMLTAVAYARQRPEVSRVNLVGLEEAGLWALLAAALVPDVSATVADAAEFDASEDDSFVEKLFVPGLRRAGDLRTAGALVCPRRLFIHNTGGAFDASWAAGAYQAAQAGDRLRVERSLATAAEVAAWLRSR